MQWPGYLHHQFKSSKSLPVPLRSLYIGFYLQERDSLWVYLAFESHELAVKCKSLSKVSGAERKSTYLDLWSLLLPGSLFLLIFKKEGGMKRVPWNEVEHSVLCARGDEERPLEWSWAFCAVCKGNSLFHSNVFLMDHLRGCLDKGLKWLLIKC